MSPPRTPPRREWKSTESVPLNVPDPDDRPRAPGAGGILVIDDDDAARDASAETFRVLGWHVACARDLRGGVELAMAEQPQIIVAELLLPDARGYFFARTLRSIVDHDIRLIGVTRDPGIHADEARAAGFDDVVEKPIDAAAIERLVIPRR